MNNKNLVVPKKETRCFCSMNTYMVGINFLYNFAHKLDNTRN